MDFYFIYYEKSVDSNEKANSKEQVQESLWIFSWQNSIGKFIVRVQHLKKCKNQLVDLITLPRHLF